MYCKNCGAPLEIDAKFCIHCGATTESIPSVNTESAPNYFDNNANPFDNNANPFDNTIPDSRNSNTYNVNPTRYEPFSPAPQGQSSLFNQNDFENITQRNEGSKASAGAIVMGVIGIICDIMSFAGVMFVHLIGIALGIAAIVTAYNQKKLKYRLTGAAMAVGIVSLSIGALSALIGMMAGMLMAMWMA